MKNLRYFVIPILAIFIASGCDDDNIDPISKVEPGADETAPTVSIAFPLEGTQIRAEEAVTSVKINFEAKDDIELVSVAVKLDEAEIATFNDFKDYRQFTQEYLYTDLTAGNHVLSIIATDLAGKSTTKSVNFEKTSFYKAIYEGEVFYMPFEGDFKEQISNKEATVVGVPVFADGKIGKSYSAVPDSYLTFPTDSLTKTKQISAVFWMKVNATPDRAGILTASPEDKAPLVAGTQNLRTSGFRIFREANAANQIFKLNVGIGNKKESWNDGGPVNPALGEWVHFAFTVSETTSTVYINGVKAREAVLETPIDWTGIDLLTIMSGVPRFTEWKHFSDLSLMDELRFFNKALTLEEVTTLMNATK
ncbi:MAG: LamG domain-containing protein [Verrucomicrobia bacterium]|nr:LamG domain-containing protein [Prolixibacteraceae bacterium]